MKKIKIIMSILMACIITMSVTTNSIAQNKQPYVVPQNKVAKNTSKVMSSYALYHDKLVIEFNDLLPNTTYKIYRKEANKKWKVVKTFTVEAEIVKNGYTYRDENGVMYDYEDRYTYVDKKLKENTQYSYKLYSCKTKKFTKTEKYWTALSHPKNVKQSGNNVTWSKSKGASGYMIYYHKHYSFLDGYYQDDVYYCKKINKNKTSYVIPEGCKVDGVYSYTKHNKGFYVDWSGVHSSEGSVKNYVNTGSLKYILKHKNQFKPWY